jgi:hypothetical protein
MKHSIEIGSGAMIYIPIFIKIGSVIQEIIREIYRNTNSMLIAKAYFYLFEIKKVG